MEGNCSQGGGFSFQDLHQNQHDSVLPLTMMVTTSQACVHNNVQRGKKNSTSEDDDGDGPKTTSPWQRVKWMDKMVKLMITALSYLSQDSVFNNGFRKKCSVFSHKKSKWKLVSKAMDERGYHVSPQQCEDKFNDVNKRYKKLNELLGRGISCDVVENPALLDKIDYLNENEKDEVRKIMRSKHLFYQEMCSYHNGNRLHLPHDPALQQSLHLTLRNRDDQNEDLSDDYEEHNLSRRDCGGIHIGALGGDLKRLRRSQSREDVGHSNHTKSWECSKGFVTHLPLSQADENRGMSLESKEATSLQKQWIESRYLELEKHKVQIQAELMELERQRFKWEMFSKKRDQKLEKMRMENEKMKLENERMTLELKRVELGAKL